MEVLRVQLLCFILLGYDRSNGFGLQANDAQIQKNLNRRFLEHHYDLASSMRILMPRNVIRNDLFFSKFKPAQEAVKGPSAAFGYCEPSTRRFLWCLNNMRVRKVLPAGCACLTRRT